MNNIYINECIFVFHIYSPDKPSESGLKFNHQFSKIVMRNNPINKKYLKLLTIALSYAVLFFEAGFLAHYAVTNKYTAGYIRD